MDSGLYAACAGLMARTDSLDTIANNLANVSTTGYRAREGSFASVIAASAGRQLGTELNVATNSYGVVGSTRMNPGEGSLKNTGNEMDAAIEGPGYFSVATASGTQYTRDGAFRVSPTGQLTTATGEAVLGDKGVIQLRPGTTTISQDGTVSSNGAIVGHLAVVEFAPGTDLASAGNNFYTAAAVAAKPATQSKVQQGMLESSNVDSVGTVVQLIAAQRNAEAMRHALSLIDGQLDKTAAQDLPRVSAS